VAEADRAGLVEILGQTGNPDCVPTLFAVLQRGGSQKLRGATVEALNHFPQANVAEGLLDAYPAMNGALRDRTRNALCSRASWSFLLLKAVEVGRIDSKEVTLDQVRQMTVLRDPGLTEQVEKRWGKVQSSSPQEKRNWINHLKLVLRPSGVVGRDAKGDPTEGKKVFQQTCGICHKLFNEGNAIGPDLT